MTEPQKKTVMIVDDDEHQLLTIGDFLAYEGFNVVRARSGKEAIKQLRRVRPNLILLDVIMPDMDGGTVANEIRSNSKWTDIPIVFLTAIVSKEEAKNQYGVIGRDPFIAKPVDPEELIREINTHIEK